MENELDTELNRILDNLLFRDNSNLKTHLDKLNIEDKIEELATIIEHINIEEEKTKEICCIDASEICRFRMELIDELNIVICIQEAVLRQDDVAKEKIIRLQSLINYHCPLNNLLVVSNQYDYICGNLFLKSYQKIIQKHENNLNLYEKMHLSTGDITQLSMDTQERKLVSQLDLLIQYYELDLERKELVNLVKYIKIKVEYERRR